MPLQQWEKREISLRYWLQGRDWYQALEALGPGVGCTATVGYC